MTVPNILVETEANAKKMLEAAGLKVGNITEDFSNNVEKGKVIRQSVGDGKKVEKGTVVDFVISIGKASVVPNLSGMTEAEAKAALEKQSLVLGSVSIETKYSDKPANTVVSQSVTADSKVKQGTAVNIILSKGPEPAPEPSETPDTETGEGDEGGTGNTETPSTETPSTEVPSTETPSTENTNPEAPSAETAGVSEE